MSLSSSALFVLFAVFANIHRSLAECPDTGIFDWSNTYCCPDTCGTCGGDGCHLRPGGATSCCTSRITETCDVANLPCIATEHMDTPDPAVTPPPTYCPTDTIADASGEKCCVKSCGSCGGFGCNTRPGGQWACCTSTVTALCSTGARPCVADDDTEPPTGCPTANSVMDSSGTKCCPSYCGTCGGYGCNTRPGGASNCCTSNITVSCSANNYQPPCAAI